jgi:hypothetical protein
MLRLMLNRTVTWLFSARLKDWISSTPSMPEIESSSGVVTRLSMISAEAPR